MRIYDIIERKRDGHPLSDSEIEFAINGFIQHKIPDYQMSALLMAIFFSGMNDEELACLTECMSKSGEMLDLSRLGAATVDKHSTGGVGDKTTMIVAPIVASLGCKIAKMTGRGLGHTGGTADKLEAIPGFQISIPHSKFLEIAENHGICVISADRTLVPADKKLYALRDVTATVDSIPLIVSSIMSKKLAGGANSIVLDTKYGSGAFMKTKEDALTLAKKMVTIGKLSGRRMSAILTNMDIPLGYNVGNCLEVWEAVKFLRGEVVPQDLKQVCVALATELVSMGREVSPEKAKMAVEDSLANGKAYEKFIEWIEAQRGDVSVFDEGSKWGNARYETEIISPTDGYISKTDTTGVGIAAAMLGAGRTSKEETIDYTAGIINRLKTGDRVNKGDVIATLYSSTVSDLSEAANKYTASLTFGEIKPETDSIVGNIIRGDAIK